MSAAPDRPDSSQRAALRVHLLGEFQVEGVSAHELGSRKARLLLKVLALHLGRPVSVDRLADAVWPAALPAHPADQLAVLVSRLRSVVGRDRIRSGEAGYRLDADWVDLAELTATAERADRAVEAGDDRGALEWARTALALAGHELLPEELDAPWAEPARAATSRTITRMRRTAARAALTLGDVGRAAEVAAGALVADPFDEESLRLLMLAEQRRGCAAAGLAAYARVRAHLADELGVDPSADTEAVHLALLRDTERVTAAPGTPAPAEAVALTGRLDESAALDEELAIVSAGAARLVLVDGEPGIGKSTLVRALCRRAGAGGWLTLEATCDPLFGGLPLQSVADALADYCATLTPVAAATLLAGERSALASLLEPDAPARSDPWSSAGNEMRLLRAFDAVFARLAAAQPVLLAIDDLHLAGPSTAELLTYLRRRRQRLLIVATRRRSAGAAIPADRTVQLGPLELADAIALVGDERGATLHARSGGNPLFLTLLAGATDEVPQTLVDAVVGIADGLGDAAPTVLAAAVLGPSVDIELLAAILRVPPVTLAADLELATERLLLDSIDGTYVFRHELVRDALAGTATPAYAALLHREAARTLQARPAAEPLEVAQHARLGGDVELAADALEAAAAIAARRFDRAAAEELLDQALRWSDTPGRRLARAHTRTMRGSYAGALDDVDAALEGGAGAAALEVGAWAAYFARQGADARSFADDGAALAVDPAVRASCLTVAGRVRHAAGDLAGAEPLLQEAVAAASGPARAIPTVWLGVLRSHQSRPADALGLLRQITRVESGGERTTELLHALLFTGHSLALQGRPLEALDALDRYDTEQAARGVPRFAGRAANFRGWILRALGQWDYADEENLRAVDELGSVDFPETRVASALDLAASALLRADADAAGEALAVAASHWAPELTFGWRLGLRLRLERARLALLTGRVDEAVELAGSVARESGALGVSRYGTVAGLVSASARAARGEAVDLDSVACDVEALDDAVGIDAWWVTAEVARAFDVPAWHDLARSRATLLARAAGPEGAQLSRAAALLVP